MMVYFGSVAERERIEALALRDGWSGRVGKWMIVRSFEAATGDRVDRGVVDAQAARIAALEAAIEYERSQAAAYRMEAASLRESYTRLAEAVLEKLLQADELKRGAREAAGG
jgi:hypothetical protein